MRYRKYASYLAGFIGLALVATGLTAIINGRAAGSTSVPVVSEIVTSDTAEPSETKPSKNEYSSYTVGPKDPRTISIPDLDVYGLVQKVGLTKAKAIAVPTNLHFAGWYVGSVAPGEKGLSIIDGHVLGRTSGGVFSKLPVAKTGQEITIEFGDKSIKKFSVIAVKTVPENDAANALFYRDKITERQLNLITCTGKFNSKTQTYDDRVIVIAKFIE